MSETWREQAVCRPGSGHDPDLWFPDGHDRKAIATAQRLCAGCPVRNACRDEAVHNREEFGIWGGNQAAQLNTPGESGLLTDDQVVSLRVRRAEGVSISDLADAYGVSKSLAGHLVRGTRRASAGGPILKTKTYVRSA